MNHISSTSSRSPENVSWNCTNEMLAKLWPKSKATGRGLLVVTVTGGDERGALVVKTALRAGDAPMMSAEAKNAASNERLIEIMSDSLKRIFALGSYAGLLSR